MSANTTLICSADGPSGDPGYDESKIASNTYKLDIFDPSTDHMSHVVYGVKASVEKMQ